MKLISDSFPFKAPPRSKIGAYEHLGCWKDDVLSQGKRLLEDIDAAVWLLTGQHYKSRTDPIQSCMKAAKNHHFVIFALQDGGQCYGSDKLDLYKSLGESDKCINGKGGPLVSDVFKILDGKLKDTEVNFSK